MNEREKYLKMWEDAVIKASDALKGGDMQLAEKYHQKMEDAYERYKEANAFEDSTINAQFANLNMALESAMPKLLNNNKQAVKECIKVIKSDKNLLGQFKFCNALRNYDGSSDAKEYINESLELLRDEINPQTIKESNKKLAKVLIKHNIRGCEDLTLEDKEFANNCDYLLTNKKKLSNLVEMIHRTKEVGKYINEHKRNDADGVNVLKMAEDVENKINSLNEAEHSLVNDIISAKGADKKKENLFNNIKKKCIEQIDKMVSESAGEDKERLLSMKETIMLKEFDKSTIVEDIAKLLEIGSILSDSDHDKYL